MSGSSDCDVLVVEDEADVRELFVYALEASGHRVGEACSGDAALAYVSTMRSPPRLIVLDLVMPGLSAADFLRALRGRPDCATIPIVLVSGAADLVGRAQALGAADWLKKPLDMTKLVEAVRRHAGPERPTPEE